MSAQVYNEAHAAASQRRHPLSDNLNYYRHQAHVAPPLKAQMDPIKPLVNAPKPPSSPPLPRQNAKVTPPSPPKVITDMYNQVELTRVGMLGEVRGSLLSSLSV